MPENWHFLLYNASTEMQMPENWLSYVCPCINCHTIRPTEYFQNLYTHYKIPVQMMSELKVVDQL